MKFKPIIGLEIHLELDTNRKAFSNQIINKNAEPNTAINAYDLGFVGEKPVVNKKMVEYAYYLAKSLKMNIANEISFDRKNYFYPDLSNGFQITQFNKPIGVNGKFPIYIDSTSKDISITEIHMEEDTAKHFIQDGKNYYDFNRAGVPLIEIVTGHTDFEDIREVTTFINQFRELIIFLEISDAKLEEGSMRIDVNISLKEENDVDYRNRVEIKNLNSISNIEKAINYEIDLQTQQYLNEKEVLQQTKKWDEKEEKTVLLRVKGDSDHYSYINETNIYPFKLSETTLNEFDKGFDKLKLSYEIRNDFLNKGLTNEQISNVFSYDKFIFLFFNSLLLHNKNQNNLLTIPNLYNFVFIKLQGIINTSSYNLHDLKFSISNIFDLAKLLEENKLNNNTLKNLIIKSLEQNYSKEKIDQEIEKINNIKLLNQNDLLILISSLYEKNINEIVKLNSDMKKTSSLLMGLIMKTTQGKVNPIETSTLIEKYLIEKWELEK